MTLNKEYRIEKHIIKKSHPMFKMCSQYTLYSKNLYNHANYIIRQRYFKTKEFLRYNDMRVIMKKEASFKAIGSNAGQMTLKLLERNWKSFFALCKEWSKNPKKLLGMPRPPKYLDKEKGKYVVVMTNMQTQIKDGYLYFAFKPFKPFNNMFRVRFTGKHSETRIVPRKGYYVLEVIYEKEVKEPINITEKVIGIDIGLNNLVAIQNNFGEVPFVINGKPLKSLNSYYNKKKSAIQSKLKKVNKMNWSNRLSQLTFKRDNKINNYIHNSSRYIVNYCLAFNVDTVIIGKNDKWKQGSKLKNFIQIPFNKLIEQLQYKLREHGINVILTEESYTSKASFIDNDEMSKDIEFSGKRIHRGLYKTKDNKLINADINGASNIMRKVSSKIFDEVKGVHLHPVIINL
ncbi:transposase [Ureibacillus chungkukjangi]|uniref:RNA-guided endonuclease InsQ/TnpB family protein n=1 Tax=Ureibacillus chungkukjangi TaxID=1202712 RepID=UPI00204204FE|nr:transposase [Ureibacillus chungkukjangi]MCM3387244.1 transposase [Ureibacillus chungkukjangi]